MDMNFPAAALIEDWDRSVEEKMKGGLTEASAKASLAKDSPDFHRAYVFAYNVAQGNQVSTSDLELMNRVHRERAAQGVVAAPGGSGAPAAVGGDPEAQWEQGIAERMRAGATCAEATAGLVRADPELHKRFVVAHNQRHGRPLGRFV